MEKQNDISLVMIVKNEEMGLEKAITSCRGFVKEVIVSVDDASTDKTLEVAKEFADRVVAHKWNGSFSEARNKVQKWATTKWVLHLDGHERVKSWDKLDEMLKQKAEVLFVKIIMETGLNFFFPRIVRREIEWQHKVHNTPKAKKNLKYEEFVIKHDRIHYQSEEGAEIRKKQREKLIFGEMGGKAKKDKRDTRSHFYLANLLIDQKKWKKAIPHYLKVAKYAEKNNVRWLARFHLGICYNERKKHLWALYHYWKAEKEQPNRWENAKMLGITYAFLGWNKKALEHWIDSFKINTGSFMFSPLSRNDAETWDFISLAFAILGQVEKMKIACQQALREERENGPGLLTPEKIKILETITGEKIIPMDKSKTIELCLVVYQRAHRLPEILQQLKNQTYQNFILNVWNNSTEKIEPYFDNFPKDKIKITNSKMNIGPRALYALAKQSSNNPIIFFDDDESLLPGFIEYNYQQYLKYGPKCILGWFTRTFTKENYWASKGATYGQEVDYIGTGGMILDREIFDKESLLQNPPSPFDWGCTDLYLCYLAKMKHGMKLIKIDPKCKIEVDGKDRYKEVDKEANFRKLRKMGWELLSDK